MGLIENIKLSIGSLRANKLRSFLTMLGIIIGISSVITIVTIGDSLTAAINDEMSSFGARNINVYLEQNFNEEYDEEGNIIYSEYVELTEEDYITDDMIKSLKSEFVNEIEAVVISERVDNPTLENGKNKASIQLNAFNGDALATEKLDMITGRKFLEKDNIEGRNLIVVSDIFVDDYFGLDYTYDEVLGKSIDIDIMGSTVKFYICGVYMYINNGQSMNGPNEKRSTEAFIPMSIYQKLNNQGKGYQYITIIPKLDVDVEETVGKVNLFFEKLYRNNKVATPIAYSMKESMDSANEMINKVKLGISAVAAISLLVGGIGVMNIMMVSITERTKEIGIRKALGAGKGIILFQFIVEAVIICIIGGIIGVAIGIGMGFLGAKLMGYAAKASISAILYSVAFCMGIGVFFGYYPASKAAKMNPIDALRYE